MVKQISLKSQQAAEQYLALLHNLGADASNLLRRKTFLTTFLRDLEKIPHDGKVYGMLLDEKLSMFTQPELKHFYQITGREFYWFWSEDEERLAAMYRGELISVNPFTITTALSLEDLHAASKDYYAEHPHPALAAYSTHLKNSQDEYIRLQWAQSLLYLFKEFEQEDFTYRASVDALVSMIENRTMKQSFLVVVRDFHPIWTATRNLDSL